MRESSRIDDDEVHSLAAGSMDSIDQFVLGIALQDHQVMAGLTGAPLQVLVDFGQGGCAVLVGLAGAQQVEVGAMQDE
ncbi:hypothetical protein D3C84_358260 [compost metagenome]